jgi:hypothetical protein
MDYIKVDHITYSKDSILTLVINKLKSFGLELENINDAISIKNNIIEVKIILEGTLEELSKSYLANVVITEIQEAITYFTSVKTSNVQVLIN